MKEPGGERGARPVKCRENEFGNLIPLEWTRRPLYVRICFGIVGVLLVLVGLIGWIVPVIPGFFLVPVGLLLLAATSRWCAACVNALERKLPTSLRRFLHSHHHWRRRKTPKQDPVKTPE